MGPGRCPQPQTPTSPVLHTIRNRPTLFTSKPVHQCITAPVESGYLQASGFRLVPMRIPALLQLVNFASAVHFSGITQDQAH